MSRFRLYPDTEQERMLLSHCAHARYVWNLAVEQHQHWKPGRKSAPGYLEQARQLREARKENEWLRAGPAQPALSDADLAGIRAWYRGAVAKGLADNQGKRAQIALDGARLARRFRDHEDMILRFATDLAVGFTSNQVERDIRPVKVQRASGGTWRTLLGLADFAIVASYLSTTAKWASTPWTPSPCCSLTAPGSRPQRHREPGSKPRTAKPHRRRTQPAAHPACPQPAPIKPTQAE